MGEKRAEDEKKGTASSPLSKDKANKIPKKRRRVDPLDMNDNAQTRAEDGQDTEEVTRQIKRTRLDDKRVANEADLDIAMGTEA